MTLCRSPHPQRPDRLCNLEAHDTGDHVFQLTYGHGPVVVASWPGTGSHRQTGPAIEVTL